MLCCVVFVGFTTVAIVILAACALSLAYEIDGAERIAVYNTVIFRQVFVAVTIFFWFVISLTLMAANVNYQYNIHR